MNGKLEIKAEFDRARELFSSVEKEIDEKMPRDWRENLRNLLTSLKQTEASPEKCRDEYRMFFHRAVISSRSDRMRVLSDILGKAAEVFFADEESRDFFFEQSRIL